MKRATTTATATTRPAEYGCDAAYDGPPVSTLLRQDRHGLYIREEIDLTTGRVLTDPKTGAVCFDAITYPTRQHLTIAGKGWRLLRLTEST